MKNCNSDKARRRSNAASKAMKKRAEQTRCPECKRGNALSRHADDDFVVYVCHWCKHEHGYFVGKGDPTGVLREGSSP